MGFVDRTSEAGLNLFGFSRGANTEAETIIGGVAAGDIDNDGDIDLLLVSSLSRTNLLYLNNGDGTFVEVGNFWGIRDTPLLESGPLFVDFNGDGNLDLVMGGIRVEGEEDLFDSVMLFENTGAQRFVDVTSASGIDLPRDTETYSITAGDVDGDQRLDLFLAHWAAEVDDGQGNTVNFHGGSFLWQNNGGGTFTDITSIAGLDSLRFTFAGNFADIDQDGDLDLLVVSDFGRSSVFFNNGGVFSEGSGSTLTDGNGMGAAVGDYDNDGDLDWFVSSVWDPNGIPEGNWDITGNRLYANDGAGTFTDVSEAAGVREGFWGWGSCFADFDNDGSLDIFHTNGMRVANNQMLVEFFNDPSRLFMSNGNGTFTERSMEMGINDTGQGRGVVCFDADRDGDLDIFVANNGDAPRFYRNELSDGSRYLEVILNGPSPNTQGIGAQVQVTSAGLGTQIREIRAGSNFESQDPAEAHFGLGTDTTVDITVRWPDGIMTQMLGVPTNQVLTINHPGANP